MAAAYIDAPRVHLLRFSDGADRVVGDDTLARFLVVGLAVVAALSLARSGGAIFPGRNGLIVFASVRPDQPGEGNSEIFELDAGAAKATTSAGRPRMTTARSPSHRTRRGSRLRAHQSRTPTPMRT